MDETTKPQPIVESDGELVQADQNVDPAAYAHYVRNFRPRPRVQWVEWDADRIIAFAWAGFIFLVLAVLVFLYISTPH